MRSHVKLIDGRCAQPDQVHIPPRLVPANEVFFERVAVLSTGQVATGDNRNVGHLFSNRRRRKVLRQSAAEVERIADEERHLLFRAASRCPAGR